MRRRIIAFGSYYHDFMKTLSEKESKKIEYILSLLEKGDRMPVKFIKHIREHGNLYELRMKYESNIYRCSSFSMAIVSWCYSMDSRRRLRRHHSLKLKRH